MNQLTEVVTPHTSRTPIAIIKTRAVIMLGGKIFLGKLAMWDFYCLPGGTLEYNETLKEGLRREIIEELGIEPKIGKLVYTQEIIRDQETKIDFWYWIENPEDFVTVDLSQASHGDEHSEVGFYDPSELGTDVRPNILPKLMKIWESS